MLEAFSNLGSDNVATSRAAGCNIYAHVAAEDANDSDLEYAVTRLVRGLESHKVSTRTGSYSTLAAFLGMKKLRASQLREIVGKTLLTDHQTSKKERRLVYIARILAYGAILRGVSFSSLILEESTLMRSILAELVELGMKRSTLLELSSPFVVGMLNNKGMTEALFEDVIWPALLPLFVNVEVKLEKKEGKVEEDGEEMVEVKVESESNEKDTRAAVLLIALTCYDKGLKTDFELLTNMDRLVRILLAHRIANVSALVELVIKYVKKQGLAEQFWDCLISQMRSSHFETICLCVIKSVEAGIHHSLIVRRELVSPLLGVFRNDDAAEQHAQAVKTLKALLKWESKEDEKMGKKERKTVIKALFGGSPNLLHEYQKLLRIITPFLVEVCTEKDLGVLESVVRKHLQSDSTISVRMCIVYLQFLSRIAQSKKASPELKLDIGKRILSIAFGKDMPNFTKHSNNDGEETLEVVPSPPNDNETNQYVSKSCMESFKSIIASSYSPEFLEEIVEFVNQDLDAFCKEKEVKKLFKKAEKRRNKCSDAHLKYILGSYAMRLILEQDKVLGEAQSYLKELLEIAKSSCDDASPGIVQFLLSTVTKDDQPPFDFESLFSRLVIEDKITEEIIQQFADAIDVEINEDQESDEDSDSSEENGDDVEAEKMDVIEDEKERSDDDEGNKSVGEAKSEGRKAKSVDKDNDDEDDDASDVELSIDMDDATEEDLQSMDKALARVFATKKKVKAEETTEIVGLMRTFRLLETLFTRNAKVCPVSIPLMLLMPIIHSLQHAGRGKKANNNLSTRIVSVLNKLNAIKKIEGADSIEKGTLLVMSRDLVSLTKQGKNRLIGDLLGDSIVMLTKCYLQGSRRTKGEDTGFVTLYTGLMDLKDDTRNKGMGISSNLISSALTTLPNWEDGKDAIVKKILSIVFNDGIRHFRRMQFLILLRTAISDKSCAPELTLWKLAAMKDLTHHATKYLSTCPTQSKQTITKELLLTLSDAATAPPEVLDVVKKMFKKLYKDNKSSEGVKAVTAMDRHQPQLRKLFIQIGLQEHVADTSNLILKHNGVPPATTPNKLKVGSKRKSEGKVISDKSASSPVPVTASKKRKSKQV